MKDEEEKTLGLTVQVKGKPDNIYLLANMIHILVEGTELDFDETEFGKHPLIYYHKDKEKVLYSSVD